MRLFFLFFFIFSPISFAETNTTVEESNTTALETSIHNELAREKLKEEIKAKQAEAQKILEAERLATAQKKRLKEEEERQILEARLTALIEEKAKIDEYLSKNNLWNRVYSNHETYQLLMLNLKDLTEKIDFLKRNYNPSKEEKDRLSAYIKEYKVIEEKLSFLKEYKDDPFKKIVKPPKIDKEPSITNPIDIITALSFEKQVESIYEEYQKNYKTLEDAVLKLTRKSEILQEMVLKTRGKIYNNYVKELRNVENKLIDFKRTQDNLKTIVEAFESDISQIKFKIKKGIENEVKKSEKRKKNV